MEIFLLPRARATVGCFFFEKWRQEKILTESLFTNNEWLVCTSLVADLAHGNKDG
jgi:hypothetical protein